MPGNLQENTKFSFCVNLGSLVVAPPGGDQWYIVALHVKGRRYVSRVQNIYKSCILGECMDERLKQENPSVRINIFPSRRNI